MQRAKRLLLYIFCRSQDTKSSYFINSGVHINARSCDRSRILLVIFFFQFLCVIKVSCLQHVQFLEDMGSVPPKYGCCKMMIIQLVWPLIATYSDQFRLDNSQSQYNQYTQNYHKTLVIVSSKKFFPLHNCGVWTNLLLFEFIQNIAKLCICE